MRHLSTRTRIARFARIVFALWLLFVFSNSFKTATASGADSGNLLSFLQESFGLSVTETVLRKCAHWLEYFVFGVTGLFSLLPQGRKYGQKITSLAFSLLLIALSDETLQLFRPGRSGEVRDVWIDFAGAICGVFAAWAAERLILRLHRGKNEK